MATEAAILGVSVNGLKWKNRLPVKAFIPVVPKLKTENIPAVGQIVAKYIKKSLAILLSHDELDEIIFSLEMAESHEDLIFALRELYDWADFHRVLIV